MYEMFVIIIIIIIVIIIIPIYAQKSCVRLIIKLQWSNFEINFTQLICAYVGKSKDKGLSHNRPSRWPKGVRVG